MLEKLKSTILSFSAGIGATMYFTKTESGKKMIESIKKNFKGKK